MTKNQTKSLYLTFPFNNGRVAVHKRYINNRQKEIDQLRQAAAQHEQINRDMRYEILLDKVNKALQLKEQVIPLEEKEEEVELPPLTEEQIKRVDRALRGNPNETLVQKFSLSITRRDMLTLSGKKSL